MKDNNRPRSRLERRLEESRENWKETALQRQQKIRKLEIKVRDLTKSREKWKKRAIEAEQELRRLKKGATSSDSNVNDEEHTKREAEIDPLALSVPTGHIYPVFIIQLAIQQVIHGLVSLRGCQKNFEIFSRFFDVQTPNFNTVRNWLFRLGLYELQKKRESRSDWILIVDLTVELGSHKCLVILGIQRACLSKTGYCLQHHDVVVLDITVLSSSTGQVIKEKLDELSKQIGIPYQIISDHGSDLKKGITLFQNEHPNLIYTYDVTHQMALFLKHEFNSDQKFQSFLQQCSRTRQQTQQTELYFLAPPKQRSKSRYLNLETHVHWALKVLAYFDNGDFSQISPEFIWDKKTLSVLEDQHSCSTVALHSRFKEKTFPNMTTFLLETSQYVASAKSLTTTASLGRRRFLEKLGWLIDYESDIIEYAQLMELVHTVQKQVKQLGLNQNSKDIFVKNTQHLFLTPRARAFKSKIETYLARESAPILKAESLLATSDIIESIFGKYKFFSEVRPLKEMGKILLMIPLFTTEITSELVKEAMESIQCKDVDKWALEVFGQSMLSKRRACYK